MTKKILLALFVMCLSFAGFAQDLNEVKKDVVKKHDALMKELATLEKCPGDLSNRTQFLLTKEALGQFAAGQSTMKGVIKQIKNGKKSGSIKVEKKFTHSSASIKTEPKEISEKNGKKTYITCSTVGEVSLKLRKGGIVSDAKYKVTFHWKGAISTKKGVKIVNNQLESVEVVAIDYTTAERNAMKKNANETAQREIEQWFQKNMPSYFKSYVKPAEMENTPQQTGEIKVAIGELKKEVTVTKELPEVKVYVDRSQYEKKGEIFAEGDDGKAFYKFNNFSFKIKFTEDDFSKGEIVGDPSFDTIFHYPKTQEDVEADKKEAIKLAKETAKLFEQRLSNYLENPNKQTASELKSLFAKKSTIEISILTNNGTKRQKRTLDQYVAKIKGATVDIEMGAPQDIFVSEEPWKATVGFTQHTERKKYCDYTGKRILMVKDEKSGEFKISKIEVVNDATPCNQE